MPKQSRLEDNAEIYRIRNDATEKEKLHDMNFKEKISYLWGYYRIHALVTIGIIAFVAYLLFTIFRPRIDPVLYIAILNNPISDELVINELQEELTQLLDVNTDNEKVIINNTLYLNDTGAFSTNARELIVTYIAARELDIIIAPESEFSNYTYAGCFVPLSEQLPTDLYSRLADQLYLSPTDDDPEYRAYGILMTENDLFIEHAQKRSEPYIIGIVNNSLQKENATKTIRYLFE